MSEQAKKFVEQWEFSHIRAVESSERLEEARRLALQCQQDAAKAGISLRDLEAAVDGDLTENMVQALSAAAFRQMAKEQWANDE
jgi:hypothetical protein